MILVGMGGRDYITPKHKYLYLNKAKLNMHIEIAVRTTVSYCILLAFTWDVPTTTSAILYHKQEEYVFFFGECMHGAH